MYPRLTRPEDYHKVYRGGRLKFGKFLAVHVFTEQPEMKIGLSVSKKVGNAVVRNSVKRKLREIVKSAVGRLPTDCFIVIGAKARSKDATFWELQQDLFRIMKGLGLLETK